MKNLRCNILPDATMALHWMTIILLLAGIWSSTTADVSTQGFQRPTSATTKPTTVGFTFHKPTTVVTDPADSSSTTSLSSSGTTTTTSLPSTATPGFKPSTSTFSTPGFIPGQSKSTTKVVTQGFRISTTTTTSPSVSSVSADHDTTTQQLNSTVNSTVSSAVSTTTVIVIVGPLPDSSQSVKMILITPYNSTTLSGVVNKGQQDDLGIMKGVSSVSNVTLDRLSITSLQQGTQNGTLLVGFNIMKGSNPRAVEAAQLLQDEASNGTLVIVDKYNNNLYTTNVSYSKYQDSGNSVSDKKVNNNNWKVPVIVVVVVVTSVVIAIIAGIFCVRRCQMNNEDKDEVVAGSRAHKKRQPVTPASGTFKGSTNADSIEFTVLEEGPYYAKKNKPQYDRGSLPGYESFRGEVKAADKMSALNNATAYNERAFSVRDKIGRTASKLSHQY